MIICNNKGDRGDGRGVTRMTGVTRDDGQEGGVEGKGEGGERGEEEGNCHGRADIEGSIRGPRGPKNQDCFGL